MKITNALGRGPRLWRTLVVVGGTLVISSAMCSATLLSVANSSFESPIVADGTTGTTPSWIDLGGGNFNPTDTYFLDATDTGPYAGDLAHVGGDGKQAAFDNFVGSLSQTLTNTL